MATNGGFNAPGPIVGPGILAGAAEALGPALEPVSRARGQRLQIQARQKEVKASRVGRQPRPLDVGISAQLAASEAKLKDARTQLSEIQDPTKQAGIQAGLKTTKAGIQAEAAQRVKTKQKLEQDFGLLSNIEDNLKFLGQSNPARARVIFNEVNRIRQAPVTKDELVVTKTKETDRTGREAEYLSELTRIQGEAKKKILARTDIDDTEKAILVNAKIQSLAERNLPRLLEITSLAQVEALPSELTGDIGKNVVQAIAPQSEDELFTELTPRLVKTRQINFLQQGQEGFFEKRDFVNGAKKSIAEGLVDSGLPLQLRSGASAATSREDKVDYLISVIGGSKSTLVGTGLSPRDKTLVGGPLEPTEQRALDEFNKFKNETDTFIKETKTEAQKRAAREFLGLGAAAGRRIPPRPAEGFVTPEAAALLEEERTPAPAPPLAEPGTIPTGQAVQPEAQPGAPLAEPQAAQPELVEPVPIPTETPVPQVTAQGIAENLMAAREILPILGDQPDLIESEIRVFGRGLAPEQLQQVIDAQNQFLNLPEETQDLIEQGIQAGAGELPGVEAAPSAQELAQPLPGLQPGLASPGAFPGPLGQVSTAVGLATPGAVGAEGQLARPPQTPAERRRIAREEITTPRVDVSIPPEVVRLGEEMLRNIPLSPASREVFMESVASAFDPEDVEELSDELGLLNDIRETAPEAPPFRE